MKRHRCLAGLLVVVAGGMTVISSASSARLQAAPAQQPSVTHQAIPPRAVIDKYCVTCHNQRLKTAGLMLDTADIQNVSGDGVLWEKVIRKLRSGAMPPVGSQRPDPATSDAVATYLESELDRAAAANPNPGSIGPFHRLSRT